MAERPTNHTLDRLYHRVTEHELITELAHNLEQFVQHERQETELVVGLSAALETHRKAMDELADAMRQLRESLFSQEDL